MSINRLPTLIMLAAGSEGCASAAGKGTAILRISEIRGRRRIVIRQSRTGGSCKTAQGKNPTRLFGKQHRKTVAKTPSILRHTGTNGGRRTRLSKPHA